MYTNARYGITARLIGTNKALRPAFVLTPPGSTTDRLTPAVAGGVANYLSVWVYQRDANNQDIRGRIVIPHAVFLPLLLRQ